MRAAVSGVRLRDISGIVISQAGVAGPERSALTEYRNAVVFRCFINGCVITAYYVSWS